VGQLDTGKVKYYDGWSVTGGREVTEGDAKRLANYAKAFFDPTGSLEKVELYVQAALFRVDYYGARGDEEVKALHLKMYRGIEFKLRRDSTRFQNFSWEYVHSYTGSGDLEGFTAILQDKKNRGWMEVKMNRNKKVREVIKYYWEEPGGDLRYTFEYDSNGKLLRAYDLMYEDDVALQDLKTELADSNFFESGLNLPREIANTSIPT
jgi:hypothetical protein